MMMMICIQVFECIQGLLKSDPDAVVKRSAAVCAMLLLRGLSKDCLKVVTEGCNVMLERDEGCK